MPTLYLGCFQQWEYMQVPPLGPFGQGRKMIQKEKKIEQIMFHIDYGQEAQYSQIEALIQEKSSLTHYQ